MLHAFDPSPFCNEFPFFRHQSFCAVPKPYFLLFKWKFDSLESEFGTYCSYVDQETSSMIKLIFVPTHYYWSISFYAVNSIFFLNFFMCMLDICSWGTNYTFMYLLPSKVFIIIWVPKWDWFLWGANPGSRSGSRSIFGLYSRSGCSPISVSLELIVGGLPQKNLESTPLVCLQAHCLWMANEPKLIQWVHCSIL